MTAFKTATKKGRLEFYVALVIVSIGLSVLLNPEHRVRYPSSETVYFDKLGVTELHSEGLSGMGIKIAVLDTGIDQNLSVFSGNRVVAWKDFVNGLSRSYDDSGHGTAVSSVVAGGRVDNHSPDGTLAFSGVAYDAQLIVGKIAGGDDTVKDCGILPSAIEWAVLHGANLINLSVSCHYPPGYHNPLDSAVDNATSSGVLVVASAGNSGTMNISVSSPGDDPNAVTVGATDIQGLRVEPYSAAGFISGAVLKPDVVAPGGSKSQVGIDAALMDGNYASYWWGTSFSTALVTGVAALLMQSVPSVSPKYLKMVMDSTASNVNITGRDIQSGYGVVNGEKAFHVLTGNSPGFPSELGVPGVVGVVLMLEFGGMAIVEAYLSFRRGRRVLPRSHSSLMTRTPERLPGLTLVFQ